MTSINSVRNELCSIAKNQMETLAKKAKVQGLDVKEIWSNNVPVSKYTSYDDTFNSTKGYSGPKLFENIDNQTYMGKKKAQLFSVKDVKTYYEQMCLLLPNLFGTDPTIYKGTEQYDYDPGDFDFSKTCPDGTKVYKKLEDGGSHDKIAVIDCYNSNNPEVCMYIDSTTDTTIAHGEFVASLVESKIAEYGLDYTVDRLGIDIVDGVILHGVDYLNYVLENINEYRGVNLSIVTYCDYSTVSDLLGETVTPSNLASKKEKIMTIVTSYDAGEFYKEYEDILKAGNLPDFSDMVKDGSITQEEADSLIALLELRAMFEEYGEFYAIADEIAKEGVPVFMASGNYSNKFNFGALLTSYVEYIGSTSNTYNNPYTGESGSYSNNSLVSRKGQATYMGNKVINTKIDVDSNGSGDIKSKGVDLSTVFVTGTSFSSPTMLVKAIERADRGVSSTAAASSAQVASSGRSESASGIETLLSAMNTSSFSIDFSTSVENTASTAVLGTTRTNSNAIFNPTYNQRTKNSNSTSKSQESKTLFGKSNSSSNKTWQGIINDLNSRVDYSATSNGKNAVNITEMNYKEVSSYFRSKMSKDVLSAGTSYYTRGKGSMFRYPEAKAQNV